MKYLIFLLALLAGCSTAPSRDIPEEVLNWAHDNVWKVNTTYGTGSGFWADDETFITACHVVDSSEHMALTRLTDTIFIPMDKISCNTETDIAVLRAKWDHPLPPGRGADIIPGRTGQAVYGAGYPMSGDLTITAGHWVGPETVTSLKQYPKGIYMTTLPTVSGDSGSPVIVLTDKGVQVVGIRLAVRLTRIYIGFAAIGVPVSHMNAVAGSDVIHPELL